MKKLKLKTLLKLGILLFGISLFIVACQKDDIIPNNSSHSNLNKPLFSFQKIGKLDINKNRELNQKLDNLIEKQEANKIGNKTIYVSDYDFYINTDYATYIENADASYHSYTFKIDRTVETDTIENLVLTLRSDGSYTPLLVKYNTTAQEKLDVINGLDIDLSNKISINYIDDLNLTNAIFNKSTAPGDDCTIPNYAIGPCDNGNTYEHDPEPFANGGMCTGSTNTLIGFSVDWDCMNDTSGGGINNPPNNNNQDGNPHSGPSNPNVVTSPKPSVEDYEEAGKKRECRKIRKLFEDYPDYKDALLTLASKTTEPIEHGIFIDNASSDVQLAPPGEAGTIGLSNNPTDKYITIAHTHNSPANSTYSVFSWDDIGFIVKAIKNGKIKTSNFVAFLITADGTYYAMTISSVVDLLDFWYVPDDTSIGATPDLDKFLDMQKVYEIYYDKDRTDGVEPKIKEANTDNNVDRNAFLEMIRDNDIGLEIFEMNDDFEDFKKLTLEDNNTDVTKEDCNN